MSSWNWPLRLRERLARLSYHYQQALVVAQKQDVSLLRLADQFAHRVIADCLVDSGLVVVSEEGEDLHLAVERYWLVDPLDGTKDFLAGNGEFTVNIALFDQGRPVLGVVFAPAINTLYWGADGMGAWRIREGVAKALSTHTRPPSMLMAVSRFHDHRDVDIYVAQNGIVEPVAIGQVLDWHTGKALGYGKPRRRNPRLLALCAPYRQKEFQLKEYESELL